MCWFAKTPYPPCFLTALGANNLAAVAVSNHHRCAPNRPALLRSARCPVLLAWDEGNLFRCQVVQRLSTGLCKEILLLKIVPSIFIPKHWLHGEDHSRLEHGVIVGVHR